MKRFMLLLLCLPFVTLFIQSCDPDPDPIDQPELITKVIYTLSSSSGGDTVVMTFDDIDGDGGNDPTITGGSLQANHTYIGSLELLNESVNPAESITEEIAEEDEDHQFFFQTDLSELTISYDDMDENGKPIGLMTEITTGNAGSGSLTIILKHQPDKSAAGVADGELSNAGGETDIEITFPVDVL